MAMWFELRDKSIRTEKDAAAAMDLPLLVSVPWVTDETNADAGSDGRRHFWGRSSGSQEREAGEKIGV